MVQAEKNNKNVLIIPDIHLNWERAEEIIAKIKHDEVIFLGDYFDDWDDTPAMFRETVKWLEESIQKPNRIHMFGNHDQHYAFPYRTFQCSGYEQWKYFIVHDNFDKQLWGKVKWYHFLDNRWLLTHAGLHKLNVPDAITTHYKNREKYIKVLSDYLDDEIVKGFRAAGDGTGSWIFNAGLARWGQQRVGGITWCDYNQEFYPLQGINQIVGHTPQRQPRRWVNMSAEDQVVNPTFEEYLVTPEILDNPSISSNICLDTVDGDIPYGIWDGKEFKIGR